LGSNFTDTVEPVNIKGLQEEIKRLKLEKEKISSAIALVSDASLDRIFVLDTNIIVDYLDTIKTISKMFLIEFAIPSVVVDELIGLTNRVDIGSPIKAFIKDLPPSFTIMAINGGLSSTLPTSKSTWPNDHRVKSNDDAIIYTACNCPGAVLISDDINMLLKAQANQLPVHSFKSFLEIFKIND
jgi:rRNA-processing protein FCF1